MIQEIKFSAEIPDGWEFDGYRRLAEGDHYLEATDDKSYARTWCGSHTSTGYFLALKKKKEWRTPTISDFQYQREARIKGITGGVLAKITAVSWGTHKGSCTLMIKLAHDPTWYAADQLEVEDCPLTSENE